MSDTKDRLTESIADHPRVVATLFALTVLLTHGASAVAAGGGSVGVNGP